MNGRNNTVSELIRVLYFTPFLPAEYLTSVRVLASRTLQRLRTVEQLSQTSLMNAFRNAAEANIITQH
jgi:hypothetical protein